jgi:hypothetical protein
MAKSNSPLGQFPASIPATSDAPDVRADINTLVGLIEKTVVMVFTTRTARDNAFSGAGVTITDGMVTWITGTVDERDERINGVWVKTYPIQYSGTGVPSNAIGVPGDIYIQYT